MPMPISISSSPNAKVGRPAFGTMQGVSATPMDRHEFAAPLRDARDLLKIARLFCGPRPPSLNA